MKKRISYAVIGSGNGGIAMAGYLSKEGFKVNLYNRTLEKIQPLINNPTIKITGEEEGIGYLNRVSSDMEEIISDVDIIMVTVPAIGHYNIAEKMAPYLKENQIIVLNPGRTGGALEVYQTIRKNGCKKDIIVAEAQTFIYACRALNCNTAHIFRVKNEVYLASIPSIKINKVIKFLYDAYPQFKPAEDVIETSINNFGAIFHPAPTLLNSGHIERGESFEYYLEGITPSIGRLLEKMDKERIELANVLNIRTVSAKDWLYNSYGAKGRNLYEAIQNNIGYKGLKSPKGLKIRYIYEDVPYSLVPISSLAKHLNIQTPAIDAIIRLAELITGKNFYKEGRTVDKLGIDKFNVNEIHQFARKGLFFTKKDGEKEVVA